jgi:hypothetical protein
VRALPLLATALTIAGLVGGCSSDDDDGDGASGGASSSSGAGATGTGGTGGDPTPAESCRQPGDKGNNLGVGEYCTPGGDECKGFPEAGLCLATVGQNQWFCTQIGCTATSDCGEAAGCVITGEGSACVLCECDDSSPQCQTGAGGSGSGGSGGAGGAATGGAGGNG